MNATSAPSRLPRLTLIFGLLIAAMGYGIYFGTGRTTFFAMAPTFLGIPIVMCGVLANTPQLRRAVVIAACAFALLGIGVACVQVERPLAYFTRSVAVPPAIQALPDHEQAGALRRMNRHNLAGLVAWPLFALFCVAYIARAVHELRRERIPSSSTAT